MRTILFIVQKEFLQIFRNRTMLPIIFVVPIIQLLILVHAATFEMKNISTVIVDRDLSAVSKQICAKFESSPFFNIQDYCMSIQEGEKRLNEGKCDLVIYFPEEFGKRLYKENTADVQLLVNAINGAAAGLTNAYASGVIADYNLRLIEKEIQIPETMKMKNINITHSHWYNPDLNYKTYMVPGILVLLVTIISMYLSAMNVVREKEIGTIEQINVTPIRKHHFIIGKLIPFWFIALFELAFGLFIGKLVFDIPMVGSLWLVFLVAMVYLISTLSIGLFLSTLSENQQQSMFISFFFMMIFLLMSGLFTSIDSMPVWAQWFNKINPIAYFIDIMRMILLKGSGFKDIQVSFYSLVAYGTMMLMLSVFRYRKTS